MKNRKEVKSTRQLYFNKNCLRKYLLIYPLTYIVIANWNGKEIMHKSLTSLFANTSKQAIKVIVVDNASTDGSTEMLHENFPDVQVIKNQTNIGFSKASNQGIRVALANGAYHILLLNNDVEIKESNWLHTLTTVLESDLKTGIVGCKLVYPDAKIQHAGGIISLRGAYHRGEKQKDKGQYDNVEFVDYVTGAALLIKTEVIRKIGLLDEGFTPLYYEDTDWCVRARFCGYKIAYTPIPILIHHCGSTAKKMGNIKNAFYYRRSAIRFFLLNFGTKDIFRHIFKFEVKAFFACILGRSQHGRLPISLRSDASNRLIFFLQVWAPNIIGLKGILSKRQQRLKCHYCSP
jgi:GT2 family glycosyltransferase